MVYVLVIQNAERELDSCNVYDSKEVAKEQLEFWAEDNGVSLDPDETSAELFFEEKEDEDDEDFIYQIVDENGVAQIFQCEIEKH